MNKSLRIRQCKLATVALIVALVSIGTITIQRPNAGAAEYIASQLGFDACAAPSTSQMSSWWSSSPYYWIGIYIGGVNRSCSQPNLTSSWVRTVGTQGWGMAPIWVGPQDPCWPLQGTYFSSNTSTAYGQGASEAGSAYTALSGLGMGPGTNDNAVVSYDLEAYTQTSACIAAAQSFVEGWDATLKVTPAQYSGIYGSTSESNLASLTGSPAPNFIWGADWDGNTNTNVMSGVPTGDWSHSQRLKQYAGGNNETYGGVLIHVDNDSANGPMYDYP